MCEIYIFIDSSDSDFLIGDLILTIISVRSFNFDGEECEKADDDKVT